MTNETPSLIRRGEVRRLTATHLGSAVPEVDPLAPDDCTPLRGVRPVRPALDPSRIQWATGGNYPFRPRPWDEVLSWYSELFGDNVAFRHMLAIMASVRESDADTVLGISTSMHDLLVRPLPAVDPPYDVVAVRAPGSLRKVRPGTVVIEHLSTTGHDDRIERPVADAVPLFWRFMIEKFGVEPHRRT